MSEHFARLVRWVMRDTKYHALYPCRVERTNDDGTVDLLPDDETMRGRGLQHVPVRVLAPGTSVLADAGARCLLGFEAGDPRRPYVAAWQYGRDTATVTFDNGGGGVARRGDSVQVLTSPTYIVSGMIGGTAKQANPTPPPLTIDIPIPQSLFNGIASVADPVRAVIIGGARRVTG